MMRVKSYVLRVACTVTDPSRFTGIRILSTDFPVYRFPCLPISLFPYLPIPQRIKKPPHRDDERVGYLCSSLCCYLLPRTTHRLRSHRPAIAHRRSSSHYSRNWIDIKKSVHHSLLQYLQ